MNFRMLSGKATSLHLAAAAAGLVPSAVFLAVNARSGHTVFQAWDMAFAVFLGAVLSANVVVWRHVLCGPQTRDAAPDATPVPEEWDPTPAHHFAQDLTPVVFRQFLPLHAAAGALAQAAPLCGLDSTISDLQRNVEHLPALNPGRPDDFQR